MQSVQDIINNLKAVFQLIFGNNLPPEVWTLIGWVLFISIVLGGILSFLSLLSKIKDVWAQSFKPMFYNREQKQRSKRRQKFAEHIEYELRRLDRDENWNDDRFTELEAEIEAEGRHKIHSIIPFLNRTRSGLRREKSLSKALLASDERLVLVEGEPGSGKSVALRHVALKMAAQARKTPSTKSIIPIYINLKNLERPDSVDVNRNLIEDFILKILNRSNDRDIEEFLDDEFHVGMQEGSWFFLFDSFDELPEILSSTEVDIKIKQYRDAVDDFLHGMNKCRGIIASRHYHSPAPLASSSDLPRFRVLPLTDKRRVQLIRKMNLNPRIEIELKGRLNTANQGIRSMAANPLFLNLLCKHMHEGNPFPENAHTVFETFIESRFYRDKERLQRRFQLETAILREGAERIAYCMTIEPGLGLNPSRENLRYALESYDLVIENNFDNLLNALVYTKLARSEEVNGVQSGSFTFAHRRFQEYFATCIVLRNPEWVRPYELLTDARWRETAVVMCQTQPSFKLKPILDEALQLLAQSRSSLPDRLLVRFYGERKIKDSTRYPINSIHTIHFAQTDKPDWFPWPSKLFHVLGLLQEGFSSRLADLPDNIRLYIGQLVLSSYTTGLMPDKKWALEVSGTAPEFAIQILLRDAYSSGSQWIQEVAFRQVAHLSVLPTEIAQGILATIVNLMVNNRLKRERDTVKAHLLRLPQPRTFISAMQLLLWLPKLDLYLHLILYIVLLIDFAQLRLLRLDSALTALLFIFMSYCGSQLFILSISRRSPLFSPSLWWLTPMKFAIQLGFIFSRVLVFVLLAGGWPGKVQSVFAFRSPMDVFTLAFALYVVLYVPFAVWAARKGKYTHPSWWAILPLWWLLYIVTNIPSLTKKFLTTAVANKKDPISTYSYLQKYL